MHRWFAFGGAACFIAVVSTSACGGTNGRVDAGIGGSSTIGARDGAGAAAGNPGGGTGGTAQGGTGGVAGSAGIGVTGSGGADLADGGGDLGIDGGSDGDPGAVDAVPDTADAAREAGTQTPECLAKHGFEYHAILVGTGFELYEGRNLIATTFDSTSRTCRASGTTRIQNGAFEIELGNLSASNYPTVAAFIDLDDDGKCSDSVDAQWRNVNVAVSGTVIQRSLTPTNFSTPGNCALSWF